MIAVITPNQSAHAVLSTLPGALPVALEQDADGVWCSATLSSSGVVRIGLDCPAYAPPEIAERAYFRPSIGRIGQCANTVIQQVHRLGQPTPASVIELALAVTLAGRCLLMDSRFGVRPGTIDIDAALASWFEDAGTPSPLSTICRFLKHTCVIRPGSLCPDRRCLPRGCPGDVLLASRGDFVLDPIGVGARATKLTGEALIRLEALGECLTRLDRVQRCGAV